MYTIGNFVSFHYSFKKRVLQGGERSGRQFALQAVEKTYDFYRLTPLNGLSNEEFVEKNFRKLIGKVYCTIEGVLLFALEKGKKENAQILAQLAQEVKIQPWSLISSTFPQRG